MEDSSILLNSVEEKVTLGEETDAQGHPRYHRCNLPSGREGGKRHGEGMPTAGPGLRPQTALEQDKPRRMPLFPADRGSPDCP